MANPFTYAVEKLGPGLGAASVQASSTSSLTGTATKSLALSPGCHSGRLHIGWSGPNAATTATFKVTVTDGTTTSEILPVTNATAAGNNADLLVDLLTDLAVTGISVIATLGGATTTGTLNLDFAGNY